jgi:hypothetical protein
MDEVIQNGGGFRHDEQGSTARIDGDYYGGIERAEETGVLFDPAQGE